MIHSNFNYELLINNEISARERIVGRGQTPAAKKAQEELDVLTLLRPALSFFRMLEQQDTQGALERWPEAGRAMAEQGLLLMSQASPWTGAQGINQFLGVSAVGGGLAWNLALKNHARLRADGVDLALIAAARSPADRVAQELALVGSAVVQKSDKAQSMEKTLAVFDNGNLARNAWAAACVELGMPSDSARHFQTFNAGGLAQLAQQMIAEAWQQNKGMSRGLAAILLEGMEEDEEDGLGGPEEETRSAEPLAAAKKGKNSKVEEHWLADQQKIAQKAIELIESPQRLFLAAAGRDDVSRSENEAMNLHRSIGAAFEAVCKAASEPMAPSVATACAASLWENAPLAASAIALCRRAGARLTLPNGKETPWGIHFASRIERLAQARENAQSGKTWQKSVESAIAAAMGWAKKDGLKSPSEAPWVRHFAKRALDKLKERDRDVFRASFNGVNPEAANAAGCARLCEQLIALENATAQGAGESAMPAKEAQARAKLADDALMAQLQWSDEEARDIEKGQARAGAAKRPDRSGGNSGVEARRAIWARLSACASHLKAQAEPGEKPQPRKKPLAL